MSDRSVARLATLRNLVDELDSVLAGQTGTDVKTELHDAHDALRLTTEVRLQLWGIRERRIPHELLVDDAGADQFIKAIVDGHYRPLTDLYGQAVAGAYEAWRAVTSGEVPERYVLVTNSGPYVYGPFHSEQTANQARTREELRRYVDVRPALIMPLPPEDGRRG